ncbi:MAG TPA: rod shape-determining protein MreC [Candidatus Acidoferrum sp.]|jgi:rod shape-determining protein MreC|nr:rod shape-determining protein MreC [Candidatus Acidoferrum sp.]
MIDALSRHRSLALLASVVLAQVLLLAYQIRKADSNVRLVRYWSVEASMPAARGGTWFFSRLGGFWSGYIDLHNARKENDDLRSQLGQLELRNRELEAQAAEAKRLEILLNFHSAHPEAQMLAAQVISASADPASDTIFINRGEQDRVRRNMGVITPDGIVGKVVEVFSTSSQVMLMTDRDMGVGAMFADTRTHGVVKGTGDPQPIMDYIVDDEKVAAGQTIVTSGEDRIFPKGLLVGTVAAAKEGNPFQKIQVRPAARLDRLEDVIVLVTQQELAPGKNGDGFGVSPAPPPPAPPAEATSSSTTLPAPGVTTPARSIASQPAQQGAPVH